MSRALSCCSVALLAAVSFGLVPTLHAQVSLPIFGQQAPSGVVERALTSRVTLEIEPDQPLSEFADELRERFGINVVLDSRALDDVGLGSDTPLGAFRLEGVQLEQILEFVLQQLELTIVVREPVLIITTPEVAEEQLNTHVYPVHDLIQLQAQNLSHSELPDYDTLIEVITSSIAPESWDDVGGAGSIEPHWISQSLVISQTRQVHRQVRAILETLRKAKGLQPAAQVPRAPASGLYGHPYWPGGKHIQGFGGGMQPAYPPGGQMQQGGMGGFF